MKLFSKRYHQPGTPPGTLVSHHEAGPTAFRIRLLDYGKDELVEQEDASIADIEARIHSDSVTWVRIQGRPTAEWMKNCGRVLNIHPLVQEDILNGGQRAKVEPYDGQLFVVMNVPSVDSDGAGLEQLYISVHKDYLVSFFEGKTDLPDPLLNRVRTAGTQVRGLGVDYLFYTILDLAIDACFPVLEDLGLRLEALEEVMIERPDRSLLQEVYSVKRAVILLRRAIWPQREVVNQLLRDHEDWIREPSRVYIRDCYDHVVQIMDLVESYRDTSASLLDIYLSSASMRLNEIMRILTVMSVIFIPMTFVAGIYGMNFERMPELHWHYGYPMALALCGVVAGGMLLWFRRKGWLKGWL